MKIELCSAHLDSLILAQEFNFDTIELCQNLEIGGITPSLAFQEYALSFKTFKTHVLIRNRAGGFVYSDLEKKIMLKDMENSVKLGVYGLVVGAINENKELDLAFLKEIKTQFPDIDLTFHRAFDDIQNQELALESLVDLGFKRILTSGGKQNALEGKTQLQKTITQANNRIEILVGGGITKENVSEIIKFTKTDSIHFSGTIPTQIDSDSLFSEKISLPNREKIEEILKKINSFNSFKIK
ncbi:MAG: copper homeostasis protein CutC [Bacteroidota bacterium]